MPALQINNSTKISLLDILAIFNLNTGKISVDLSPSVFIADGAQNVVGATLKITSPSGYIVSDGATNVFTPNMDQIVIKDMPKMGDIFEYGIFKFEVVINDGTTQYTLKKNFRLCAPTADGKSNTGDISYRMDANCATGWILVYGGEGIPYNGVEATDWVKNITFYYPSDSGLAPDSGIESTPFAAQLRTGVNKVKGTAVGTFELPDNFQVIIKYTGEFSKDVRCNLNWCHLYEGLVKLMAIKESEDCNTLPYREAVEKIAQGMPLMMLIIAGYMCGNDIDDFIVKLEKILGVSCDCSKSTRISFVGGGMGVLPDVFTASTIEPTNQFMTILTKSGIKKIQFVDATTI